MADGIKKALDLVSQYQDAQTPKMKGFDWRPLKDVHEELEGLPEIPDYIHNYGDFMHQMAAKAATKGLTNRDLLKAYAITRASIHRGAISNQKVREQGLIVPDSPDGKIRPEGAMGEWLKTQMGQRYLDAAEDGRVDQEAVDHAQKVMSSFGNAEKTEGQGLPWAVKNLSGKHELVSRLVGNGLSPDSPVAEWRDFATKLHGIKYAKSGFIGSLLGLGNQPTWDARQINLHTGVPEDQEAKRVRTNAISRAGADAVDRLAARQTAMNPRMDPGMEPFRQHLTHHAVWDKTEGTVTPHEDLMDAMRNAKDGGRIGYNNGGKTFGVGGFEDHIIAHAIKALGIPGHGLGDVNPEYIRALQKVSTPFSDDPEVVKKALAISQGLTPPMTTKKGESTSYYNYSQPMAPDEVKTKVGSMPGVTPLGSKSMSWEDFYKEGKGGTIINVGGDRSNLGRLTHINGKKLNWPVDMQAGPKYMLEPNPGAVWANSPGHTTSFNRIISEAAKKGPVYGVYTPMGPKSADQAYHMFDALMAQVDKGAISKADAKEFDDMLKAGMHAQEPKDRAKFAEAMKGWPGILNPKEASEFAKTLPGIHRKAVVEKMDLAGLAKKGFPNVGITRAAITDPDLLKTPGNMMGHRIVQFDPDKGPAEEKAFKHLTYQEATPGKYVGDVPLVQRQYAMPDVMEQMTSRTDWAKPGLIVHPYSEQPTGRSSVRKMFEEQKQTQPINQRMLDSIMTGLERQKAYGFNTGGAVRPDPTEAQKKAGNYRKGHMSFQGLPITLESMKGQTRSGVDPNGQKWSVKLPYDYGYIKRTEGADGDHVDVCIGPDHTSDHVFLVDQHDKNTGKFDEHKVMLGYRTKDAAMAAYCNGFSDGKGPDRMKAVVRLSMPEFKTWLKKHDTKRAVRGQGHIDRALSMTSVYTAKNDRDAG
jgi:hypothetical protein